MKRLLLLLFLAQVTVAAFAESQAPVRHSKRNVEVEFEAVEGASLYEIRIVPESGSKKAQLFKLKDPKWSANIKPGLYNMSLRAYDERGVPGEWSPPSELKVKLEAVTLKTPGEGEHVKSKDPTKTEVSFHWEAVPSARKYKLSITGKTSGFKEEHDSESNEFSVSIPVAEDFEWNVVAVDAKDELGEANEKPGTFAVLGPRLAPPAVQAPLSKYVENVSWRAPEFAQSFATVLEYKDPKTGQWSQVERNDDVKEAQLKFDTSRPSGRYRLNVQAKAEKREASKVGRREFDVLGGFKGPDELKTAQRRDAITRPTSNYVIASYMISDISYSSKNYDTNSNGAFSALGGTMRLGYGHQGDSAWGEYIFADLSGFTIDSQTQTYAAMEAHVTRKLEFGQSGILLAGAGLFYKELPIVSGSSTLGFESLGKLTEIGPHIGASYWMPLSQRWGVQANVRLYDALMGSAATGGKVENSISYQYGLLGSYRLTPSWMGYIGYAFRHDEANYQASPSSTNFSSPGESNSVTIEGQYLNLLLEFSF